MTQASPDVPDNGVDEAVARHLEWADASGRAPSVIAVARDLKLSNTTFRRNFPEHVDRIRAARAHTRQRALQPPSTEPPLRQLTIRNARLKRVNHDLRSQLAVAASIVQMLSHRNDELESQLLQLSEIRTITSHRIDSDRNRP